MAGRKTLIAGNWKMNGGRAQAAQFLAKLGSLNPKSSAARQLLICPPATLIALMAEALGELGVSVGGQDCHAETSGAFTGDLSAAMLSDLGCSHVIVGHSERRQGHHETDMMVQAKAQAVLNAGLTPIVCVGEIWADRESGQAERVVRAQVKGSIPPDTDPERLIVAYEPVWAIGTGKVATTDDIAQMHGVIRKTLGETVTEAGGALILYGGSVKPSNAGEILALDQVNGALIGGASLDAADFMAIAESVNP